MGVTYSISKLIAADRVFEHALHKQLSEMDYVMNPWVGRFDQFVDDFYTSNDWDRVKFGVHRAIDLQSQRELSLTHIAKKAELLTANLLNGDFRLLLADGRSTNFEKIMLDRLQEFNCAAIMINAAVSAICLAMCAFNRKRSDTIDRIMHSQCIAPGLTLHVFGYSTLSGSLTTPAGDSIVLSSIGYQLAWSIKQECVQIGAQFLPCLNSHLAELQRQLRVLECDIEHMTVKTDDDHGLLAIYSGRYKVLSRLSRNFQAQVDRLAKKYEPGEPQSI